MLARDCQGLLEGVRGELDELEPWVVDDVDTIASAAAGMSVILNDVLDLGQVRGLVPLGTAAGVAILAVHTGVTICSCNEAPWS